MSLVIIVACALVFVSVVIKYLFSTRKLNHHKLPPGPKPWPVVGNLPEMLISRYIKKQPPSQWINALMNGLDTDIACIRLGGVHVVPVRSPEIALEFLREHDAAFASRPTSVTSEIATGGFLTTYLMPEGEQWSKMRRLMSFHVINPAARMGWARDRVDQEADDLVRFVHHQYCKGSSSGSSPLVNVRIAASRFCGNVMRRMLFNRRCIGDGSSGLEEEEQVRAAHRVAAHVFALSPSDYNSVFRWLDLDGHGKIVREAMRNLTKHQDRIIDERVKMWREYENNKVEPEDMLDLFIIAKDATGHHLSTQEIKAQCAELFFATVHTPASIVEWTLAEMMNQPHILHKAVSQIDAVVGKDRLVQESDFPSLPYVTAAVREAFRLHPISPFLPTHVSSSDVIVRDYLIPKGSHFLLSRYELGRNPKVWDEPLRFKPERHLKDDGARVEITEPELKFVSFGRGRRGCVGVALGSAMVTMLLTRLLQGFSWRLPLGKEKIDLVESTTAGLSFLDQPLHALVDRRLRYEIYQFDMYSK